MFDRAHLSWLRRAAMALAMLALASTAAAQTRGAAASQPPAKLTDNLNVFIGLDGSKQPQDLGVNAHMGARLGVNLGIPISRGRNLGGQVGVAVNFSDAAVHVLDQIDTIGTSSRMQMFVTGGVFQRTSNRMTWAAGVDLQYSNYYDTWWLGQVRGQVGKMLNDRHEVGALVNVGVMGADAEIGETGLLVRLEPIGQFSGYSSHVWPSGGRTALWAGLAGGHDNIVLAFDEHDARYDWVFVYGAGLQLPLSDRFAIAGAANFVLPTATGTVDAFLGVLFSPGGGMMKGGGAFRPVMPVANNPMMPVNVKFR